MLVESPDGRRALLGHSKKVHLPLYTCLAGFIDQVRWARGDDSFEGSF